MAINKKATQEEYPVPHNLNLIAGANFFAIGEDFADTVIAAVTDEMQATPHGKRAKRVQFSGELSNNADNPDNSLFSPKPLRPSEHTMLNTLLVNNMQKGIVPIEQEYKLEPLKDKPEAITRVFITVDDDSKIAAKYYGLPETERQISDAICSVWEEALRQGRPAVITPSLIYELLPGGGKKASSAQLEAIRAGIKKFRSTMLEIDATEEAIGRGAIKPGQTLKFNNYMLQATGIEVRAANGRIVKDGYLINSEPIMLTYAKMTNQIITVGLNALNIREVRDGRATENILTMTEPRKAMTTYMLRRIKIMKSAKKNKREYNPVIAFDTVFKIAGIESADRKQTGLNKKFCFDVLDYWKAGKIIKGYTTEKSGKSIRSVSIIL